MIGPEKHKSSLGGCSVTFLAAPAQTSTAGLLDIMFLIRTGREEGEKMLPNSTFLTIKEYQKKY